jgi:hypothetical protein
MRALTYDQAVELGLEPREYAYEPVIGEFEATLDFKVWGKSVNLQCFFSVLPTGERFRVSAFRDEAKRYTPKDGRIDFSADGLVEGLFRLKVGQNKKGRAIWLEAELVKAPE